jgi:hypothetical protein
MASLLEGSLAATIGSALSGIFMDATLSRDVVVGPTDPYDPSTGTRSTTVYACKAIHEDWSLGYKRDNLVSSEDRKVLILAASLVVEPRPGDRITVRSSTFTVVPSGTSGQAAVSTDPAKAVWILRARK